MVTNQQLLPDHYLSQGPSREYTPPHFYKQIIIPLNDFEKRLAQSLGDLMEWWIGDPEQGTNLNFLMNAVFQQFGDCYDQNHIQFVGNLEGRQTENGNVPGYPSPVELQHLEVVLPEKWSQFVAIFRSYAWQLYALVNLYVEKDFPSSSLVFSKWIPGGLIFYVTPRQTPYMID